MKINIFGLGYVGCVSAACLARDGHEVSGVDIDNTKIEAIQSGRSPIVEPGLDEVLKEAVDSGRLTAGTEMSAEAKLSVICVGTPSNKNGSLGLDYLQRVVAHIGDFLKAHDAYHVVNIRSTVLPGTVETLLIPILEKHSGKKAGEHFGVCMNPEFMRESTSVEDFYNPPFTLIGQLDERSGDLAAGMYSCIDAPIFRSPIREAEILKYACNTFHALKVTFANEIGNICKKMNIDSHQVMELFCKDDKLNLSPYYLKPGFAYGGSCLPKDLRALLYMARQAHLETPVLRAIEKSNRIQVDHGFEMIRATGKKKIGILGLSFKAGTDDLRESPMVELIERLIGKGFDIAIYDNEVSMARIHGSNKRYIEKTIPHISSLMTDSIPDLINRSEVILIGNRSKDFVEILDQMSNGKLVLDLVRIVKDPDVENPSYDGICW